MGYNWDPTEWGGLGDVPVVGDVWKGVFGDPDSIKQAYDAQIKASKESQAQMQAFLMGQKGQAQAFYGPMQQMYQRMYGSQPGIAPPQVPGVPSRGGR